MGLPENVIREVKNIEKKFKYPQNSKKAQFLRSFLFLYLFLLFSTNPREMYNPNTNWLELMAQSTRKQRQTNYKKAIIK